MSRPMTTEQMDEVDAMTSPAPIPVLPTVPTLPEEPGNVAVSPVAEPEPEPEKPEAHITPKDTVDALRFIQKEKLLQPDDGPDLRKHIQNLVITWLTDKRAGIHTQDWETWYTTPDLDDHSEADESEEDPT